MSPRTILMCTLLGCGPGAPAPAPEAASPPSEAPPAAPVTPALQQRWDVPTGFSGWVAVRYGKEGAPAIPEVQGRQIYAVPADGRMVTSTPFRAGRVEAQVLLGGQPLLERPPGEGMTRGTPGQPFTCCAVSGRIGPDRGGYDWYAVYVGTGPAIEYPPVDQWFGPPDLRPVAPPSPKPESAP
jgi:hypothetical protein